MIICKKCGSLERTKRGDECKNCVRIRAEKYRLNNPEKVRASNKKWHQANANKVAARSIAWRKANPERAKEIALKWAKKHIEQTNPIRAAWRKANSEHIKKVKRMWNESNPQSGYKYNHTRRAAKQKAVPSWFCEFDIFVFAEAYHLCKLRKKATNTAWEIDHIVPLVKKIVCGLHCASNFQVITSIHNRSKGNHYWPDMP